MKRGLLTLVTAAIAFRTGHWRSDKRQWHVTKSGEPAGFGVSSDVSPSRAEASIPTRRQTVSQYLPVLYYLPLISSCIR